MKMTTFSGRSVDPLNLTPDDIVIEDIAHHLANINRFCGACKKPISVAHHSVYVARLCGAETGGEHALQALLHDATETYLGDVIRPLKKMELFHAYEEAEDRAQAVIFEKFGIAPEIHESVNAADKLMVKFEAIKAFGRYPEAMMYAEPPTEDELLRIGPWGWWGWQTSRQLFHITFNTIMEGRNGHH